MKYKDLNNQVYIRGKEEGHMTDIEMFDIVYADLRDGKIGSEQSGIHPYIVIQNNTGNKHCPTFLGMSLTSELKREYLPTHCVIHKSIKNGLKNNSMLLGETLTQIDKSRIINKIGYIDNEKQKNEIINVYLANITGRKRYTTVWYKIITMFFKLVKEGADANAA